MWNITLLWLFLLSCSVLYWLYFFLKLVHSSHPWMDFNRLRLKWHVVTQGCAFWRFGWRPAILRGSEPQNPAKGDVVSYFPAKLANVIKSQISSGKDQIDSKFYSVIEPHSWLREWSRMAKLQFKMANGRHIAKCWKCYNSRIEHSAGGRTREPILMKFGTQQQWPQWQYVIKY